MSFPTAKDAKCTNGIIDLEEPSSLICYGGPRKQTELMEGSPVGNAVGPTFTLRSLRFLLLNQSIW